MKEERYSGPGMELENMTEMELIYHLLLDSRRRRRSRGAVIYRWSRVELIQSELRMEAHKEDMPEDVCCGGKVPK